MARRRLLVGTALVLMSVLAALAAAPRAALSQPATHTPTNTPTPSSTPTRTPSATPTPVPGNVPVHDWGYALCDRYRILEAFDHHYPSDSDAPNRSAPGGMDGIHMIYSGELLNSQWRADGAYEWSLGVAYDPAEGAKSEIVHAVKAGIVEFAGIPRTWPPEACQELPYPEDWHRVEIKHNFNEGSTYRGLGASLVTKGQYVVKGEPIGVIGPPPLGFLESVYVSGKRYRYPGDPYWPNFDPLGWDKDHSGYAPRPMDFRTDPWYRHSGIISERKWLPGPPDPLGCADPCGGTGAYVDNLDPGFSCTACLGELLGDEFFDDSTETMSCSGTAAETGRARWGTSLPPGRYQVEVFVAPSARGRSRLPRATRFLVGNTAIVADLDRVPRGWVTLGVFDYDVSPYVELSDGCFDGQGWIDSPFCAFLYPDAVRFSMACGGAAISPPVSIETSVPPTPAVPPTPCIFGPCRTATPPGGGG
jgi:hypothetical protein